VGLLKRGGLIKRRGMSKKTVVKIEEQDFSKSAKE
jgi:hypothetical protein